MEYLKTIGCFFIVIILGFTSISCNRGNQKQPLENTTIKETVLKTDNHEDLFEVDKSELVDQTVQEIIYNEQSYNNENGELVEYSKNDHISTWMRTFKHDFTVDTYMYKDRQFLYQKPNGNEIICAFSNGSKLTSSLMYIIKSDKTKKIECWIKVTDNNNTGWVYNSWQDPYENNNWIIVGTVQGDNKDIIIRKYNNSFSVQGDEPAYDRPSLSGKIIWKSKRTADNSQINLTSIYVTNDTYRGEYFQEHWVKVKDSYGRIGWFPGDKLDVERGGPKYLSPENIARQIFYEP